MMNDKAKEVNSNYQKILFMSNFCKEKDRKARKKDTLMEIEYMLMHGEGLFKQEDEIEDSSKEGYLIEGKVSQTISNSSTQI